MPGSGVISCSGPACAKTRPVRALYNPDFFSVQRLHGFRQVV